MKKITKLEAARRQLDCAIRLYFENDDLVAVHALSRAAFRVLYDLQPKGDDFKRVVSRTISYIGWGNFNELTNFLKHADQDPVGVTQEPDEKAVQLGIGFAAMLYRRSAGNLTPEMQAFHLWMKVMHPEHFPDVREPDWEFEQDYLDANEIMKKQPRDVRMMSGKALLQVIKEGK